MATHVLKRKGRHGFVLITMALSSVAIFGAIGLAIDVGRIFIAKNESQAFADSAALAAVMQLDGTSQGITAATNAVVNNPTRWNFATSGFSSPTTDFAVSAAGPWSANPADPTNYAFARVQTSVSVPLYFLPVMLTLLPGTTSTTSQTVRAASIAGQIPQTTFTAGLAPFVVVSTVTSGPDFGLTKGNQYTIRWGNQFTGCSGESQASLDAVANNWSHSTRGYWGNGSASGLRALIDQDGIVVSVGTQLGPYMSNGAKDTLMTSLQDRVNSDTDATSTDWATYSTSNHNGRRLMLLPIVNPNTNNTVLGYSAFLLLPADNYSLGGNGPACAIYVGAYLQGATHPGVGGGALRARLVQ